MDIAAAWLPDPSRQHEMRYWDGQAWTEHVSNSGVTGLDSPLPPPRPVPTPPRPTSPPLFQREDPGFTHFLRYVAIWFAMVMLVYLFLIGLVWFAFMLSATGRRKRDVLMLLIPVWGTIVVVQTIWRYTARNLSLIHI